MKYPIQKIIALVILCLVVGCTSEPKPPDQDVKALLQEGAVLVDVRSQEEFDSGHLKEALHLPFEQILELPQKAKVTQDSVIVVYCQSGGRASKAKKTLDEAGYKNVHNAGGYEGLKAQGLE